MPTSYAPSHAAPLLVAVHGCQTPAEQHMRSTLFNRVAEREAAVEAAAYPDLFAAVGIVASAGYADGPCFTTGVGIPVVASAQLAHEAMGQYARVVPRFVIGSDGDLAFPASCSDKALEQGLRTNNVVLSGTQEEPLALSPVTVRDRRQPDGYAYTVSTYRDPSGCLIAERWIIHGMPHAWPGGTADPKYKGFTDARAPSGAEGTWRFMKRFRKSDAGMPCAETPPCRARWRALRAPAGAKRLRAVVNGRRVAVRSAGTRVRVRLPATHRTRTRIAVRGRAGGGERFTRRRAYPGCA